MEPHISRALDTLPLIPGEAEYVLDMGSGGGLPGLPLALARPQRSWVLLDGSVTRCAFLSEAVRSLGLSDRVDVVTARAEDAGHRAAMRGAFDAVVARSFGPPAVTAECGAAFLRVGGHLIVAEPPAGGPDRWPVEGVGVLGLRPLLVVAEPSAFEVLVQDRPCPARYPRRTGIPAKRPLF